MSLYQDIRPKKLEDLYGNKAVLKNLEGLLSREEPPQVYLLKGEAGCGKTTIGRIIADKLDSKGNDFREINSADFRGIETMRKIIQDSRYKALESKRKCWLIDEFHQVPGLSQDNLLKLLEDPPKHCIYILATTNPEKVKKAILQRCAHIEVQKLNKMHMKELLTDTCTNNEITASEKVINKIVECADGHPRQAIQFLDKIRDLSEEEQMEVVKKEDELEDNAKKLCRMLINGAGFDRLARLLTLLKYDDPEKIRRLVMGYAQTTLLTSQLPRAGTVLQYFTVPFWDSGFPALTFACWQCCKIKD